MSYFRFGHVDIFVEQSFFGKYCGKRTGQKVTVGGVYTLVKFHSNGYGRGFFFRFNSVPAGMYRQAYNIAGSLSH